MVILRKLFWDCQAAADFIRSPETFQFDMLDSPAVQQLQSDSQHGPVFQLLSVLLAGDVQVFSFVMIQLTRGSQTHMSAEPCQAAERDAPLGPSAGFLDLQHQGLAA